VRYDFTWSCSPFRGVVERVGQQWMTVVAIDAVELMAALQLLEERECKSADSVNMLLERILHATYGASSCRFVCSCTLSQRSCIAAGAFAM
jgi:hypothetical protein